MVAQDRDHAPGLPAQVGPGPLARVAQLGGVADGHGVGVLVAEDVLGVGQARSGEPLRPGHLPRAEHLVGRRVEADLEEVADRLPEPLQVIDGPLPQGVVVVGVVADALRVAGQRGALDPLLGRCPQGLVAHLAQATGGRCRVEWRSADSRCAAPGRSFGRPWRGWGRRRRSPARRWRGAPLPCCSWPSASPTSRGPPSSSSSPFSCCPPLTWKTRPAPSCVNLVALVIYVAVALLVGFFVGFRRLRPVREWLNEDREPTEAEQRLVLRSPVNAGLIAAALWALAVVVCGSRNRHLPGLPRRWSWPSRCAQAESPPSRRRTCSPARVMRGATARALGRRVGPTCRG